MSLEWGKSATDPFVISSYLLALLIHTHPTALSLIHGTLPRIEALEEVQEEVLLLWRLDCALR